MTSVYVAIFNNLSSQENCLVVGLTINLAKTQVMQQGIKETPLLFIHNYKLEVVHEFVYLGSTITDNLSVDSEPNKANREGCHDTLQAH